MTKDPRAPQAPARKPDQDCTEAEILERYRPFLVQQAKRFLKQGMEFEDLMQEGSLALIKSFRAWRPDGGASMLTWIRHPVLNAMTREVTQLQKHAARSMDEPIATRSTNIGPGDDASITLHDLLGVEFAPGDALFMDRLQRAIEKLSEKERRIIAYSIEGKTLLEIGAVFGVSRERVRQIRNNAIDSIRDKLQRPPRHLKAI